MKRKLTTIRVALNVIGLFGIAMAMSCIPEIQAMKSFFGDYNCYHDKNSFGACTSPFCDNITHWGIRHIWWFWMCLILFLIGLFDAGLAILNEYKNYFDNDK